MVDSLVGQHGFEGVGFGVDPSPHQVVISVGRVDLMEPMGVAYLADQLGVGVNNFKG